MGTNLYPHLNLVGLAPRRAICYDGSMVLEAAVAPQAPAPAPSGRKTGRPTKFTEAARHKLLDAIRQGHHMEPACGIAGISYRAFRDWMAAGEQGDPTYAQFSQDVHQAEAIAEQTLVGRILTASETDWRPAGWILARRFPDRYAEQRRGTVVHSGEITVTHDHILSTPDLGRMLQLLSPEDPNVVDSTAIEVPPTDP